MISYILFFIGGLAFGYAAPPRLKWAAVLFPLVIAALAAYQEGIDGTMLLRLLLALLITVGGIVIGVLFEQREAGASGARAA